jgi:putative transposase
MSIPEAKRLRELESENTRLKKLLPESMFENEIVKEAFNKSGSRNGKTETGAVDGR